MVYSVASGYRSSQLDVLVVLGDGNTHHTDYQESQWLTYWADNGEQLVWDSWTKKYSDYIDPSFLETTGHAEVTTCVTVTAGTLNSVDEIVKFAECDGTVKDTTDLTAKESAALNLVHNIYELGNEIATDETWKNLWEQHSNETYWFYHEWFMQWLKEESCLTENSCCASVNEEKPAESRLCSFVAADCDENSATILSVNEQVHYDRACKTDSLGQTDQQNVCSDFTALSVNSEHSEPVDGHTDQKRKHSQADAKEQSKRIYYVLYIYIYIYLFLSVISDKCNWITN